MTYTLEDARQALLDLAQEQIDAPFQYGFLGRIPGDDDTVFEFKIPYKPGYFYCRIENALGLQEAECRCKIGLDPYTRVKFARVNGVLEAIEYVLEDAARNYSWAGGTLNSPGLPPPNRGMGGPLDMNDDDILNAGAVEFTELIGPGSTELTIASGAVMVTQALHRIDTQADAGSDDLDTMNVTATRPYFFWIRAENAARTVVVKHNVGNILTFSGTDVDLDDTFKALACVYDPALDKVLVLGSEGGSGTGGNVTVGDYADARPATPTDGDTFIPKDGYWWEVFHDSIWNPYKHNLLLTAPPSTGWSWDNQGSATIDSSLGALHLYVPAGATSLSTRARYRTAPSAPYTITIHLDLNILTATNPYAMVGFRQSSDGKLACLMFSMGTTTTQPKLFSSKFTSSTVHSANYVSADIAWIPEWIQIIDDNTNRILKYSKDGKNFLTLHSIGRTDFLTADELFFGVAPISTANDASMTIYSWDEA